MEDTHSAHYGYLSPPAVPDPNHPAYQLIGGGRPGAAARAAVDIGADLGADLGADRARSQSMPAPRRGERRADSASTLGGTGHGVLPPPPATVGKEQDSTERLLEELDQLETVAA